MDLTLSKYPAALRLFNSFRIEFVDSLNSLARPFKYPLFAVLQKVIRQHLGIEDIIDSILDKIGDVSSVAIVGDYAKGIDSGLIKVVLLGDEINVNYLEDLIVKVEKKITRKVSFKIVKILPKGSLVIYNKEKI